MQEYGNESSESYNPWPVIVPNENVRAIDLSTGMISDMGIIEAFGTPGTPTLQLIDGDGRMVWESESYYYDEAEVQEMESVVNEFNSNRRMTAMEPINLGLFMLATMWIGPFWMLMLILPEDDRTVRWMKGPWFVIGPLAAYLLTVILNPQGMIDLFTGNPMEIADTLVVLLGTEEGTCLSLDAYGGR